MKCPQCGAAFIAEARFCQECGGSLTNRCDACGAINRHGAKFCLECGIALSAALSTGSRPSSAPRTPPASRDPESPASGRLAPAPVRHGYTPAYLVQRILTTRGALEGERKTITVLFADVVDSSAFAQRVDPERLHELNPGLVICSITGCR